MKCGVCSNGIDGCSDAETPKLLSKKWKIMLIPTRANNSTIWGPVGCSGYLGQDRYHKREASLGHAGVHLRP